MSTITPLLGHGYVQACARGLAEQLVAAVPFGPGAVVATLLDEDAVLEPEVSHRLDGGSIIGIHDVRDLVAVEDGSCDAVLSLLTAGFAGPDVLPQITRILRRGGHAALLVYDRESPPAHEAVLLDVLRAHGITSAYLDALLPDGFAQAADHAGFVRSELRDVARFDGPQQFWQAMVAGRPVAAEVDAAPRDEILGGLAPWRAADDTMRIPVSALLLSATA